MPVPGRVHVARVRDLHVRAWVCEHRGLCYALTILFIAIMVLL